MKTTITLFLSLTGLALFSSEPDVDYHVVNTLLRDGQRIEVELNPVLDGLSLEKVELEAKNISEAQASLIINGITLESQPIISEGIRSYTFNTAHNAIIFGYNLDTIEIEAEGTMAIKHVILEAK